MFRKIRFILLFLFSAVASEAQYISEVLEYRPAPGQFINSSPWGMQSSANSLIGGVTGSLSLGAFGGYVVFKFEQPVENHPDNPFGVDFTIFGNPLEEWSEQGIVSVMKDENGNGLPDDTWYELAGSDYFFSTTLKNYEVTYTNPKQDEAADVAWADNQGNTGFILKNGFHEQPYYPLVDEFNDIPEEKYTLSGTKIADAVDRTIPTYIKSYRKPFGYVDNRLRGAAPYTVPDNPYTLEKENSGGDAFDIDWAVDENGEYISLDVIHFVKVHNAILADAGWLGEVSTEITGAVDVEADETLTGNLDMIVIKELPKTIKGQSFQLEAFVYHKGKRVEDEVINWTSNLSTAEVDNNNQLTFSTSGELTLTASLASKPEIKTSVSAQLEYEAISTAVDVNAMKFKVYPNPVSETIFIEGIGKSTISIFDIMGNKVLQTNSVGYKTSIRVEALPKGIYTIKINDSNAEGTVRFVKK